MVDVTSWRVAAASLLVVTTAACTAGGGREPGSREDPSTLVGHEYTAEVTEPTHLAPGSNCYESECFQILSMINDPLVRTDPATGELVLDGLAASIVPDEDRSEWTVRLQPGREFHNGEPVDAASFVRAWNYAQDPQNTQATAHFMSRIEGAGEGPEMSGLQVVDELTFRVALEGRFSQFGQSISNPAAFAPMAQECLDDLEACNEQPIGTGPYQMDGPWRHDESITVTKWSDYAGQQPAESDTVTFRMYTSPTAAYQDFRNGGLDVLSLAPEVYLDAKDSLGDAILEEPTTQLTFMGFPVDRAPYDDPRVRRAISMSIDRRLIVDQVLGGLAYPSTDLVPPPVPGSSDDACGYCVHDPARARALLAEAGVDLSGETVEYHFDSGAGHDAWIEAAARQVQDNLGLDYELRSMPWAQYLDLLRGGDVRGPFRFGWNQVYPSPANYLEPLVGSDAGLTGYSSAVVDGLIADGDRAPSLEAGIPSYRRAADTALEDLPLMPMWSGRAAIAVSDALTDVRYDPAHGNVAFKEIQVVR